MNNCHPKKLGSCLFFYFYTVLCFFLLAGCQPKNTADEKGDLTERDATVARDSVLKSLRTSNITNQLQFNADVFNKGWLNDVERTNHYLKRGNKGAAAANLGVYMSDLACLVALDKHEEARRYFDACHRLSEFVGMEKQFSQAIQFGFNEIIAGDKRLEKSLEELFQDASNTTQEEFKKLHASALTGYYIEELYHLASFVKSYNSVDGTDSVFFAALKVFVSQKDELDNLITYFDHIKLKSEGISAYQDLLALQTKYLALDDDRLLRETDASLLLRDKSLQDIFDSLSSFRKRIIDF